MNTAVAQTIEQKIESKIDKDSTAAPGSLLAGGRLGLP